MDLDAITQAICKTPFEGRRLVALAGPPASGKSTIAERIAAHMSRTQVVPMDGFHLNNDVLDARELRQRKGAPETFDVAGFTSLIRSLRDPGDISFPTFDRRADCSVDGGGTLNAACETVIVEGNYLLLDALEWRDLWGMWDLRISLDVPFSVLRDRLIGRWIDHGLTPEAAIVRAEQNDLINAKLVLEHTGRADLRVKNG